jgi:hypothetical protein
MPKKTPKATPREPGSTAYLVWWREEKRLLENTVYPSAEAADSAIQRHFEKSPHLAGRPESAGQTLDKVQVNV